MKGFLKQLIGKKMSDKSLILTIGLTDKFDEKWGVVSKHKTQQLSSLYNLKLLDPDSVKETVSWRLNMDNPYVVKIIAAWEKAIRRPHLKMMCHMHTEFDMDPSYLDMRRYMEIVPLIPSLPQEQLDMSIDLSQDCGLVSDLPWGSIGTSVYQILNFNDITTKLIDAGRDDAPYNNNSFPAYDPMNLYEGQYTPLDKMFHEQETSGPKSTNAMDVNWGGLEYSEQAVQEGLYEGDYVYKTSSSN